MDPMDFGFSVEVKVLRLNGEPMEFQLSLEAKVSDLPGTLRGDMMKKWMTKMDEI